MAAWTGSRTASPPASRWARVCWCRPSRLPATGLVTPESLVNYTYRIALNGAPADPVQAKARITQFKDAAQARFPDAGWNIRDRGDAAPGIKRFVEQLTMFLTLVGLVALGVGGVGAGQAIIGLPGPQARRHRHPENPGRQRRLCLSGVLPAGDGGGGAGDAGRRRAGRGPALRRGLVLWRCAAGAAQLRALSRAAAAGAGLRPVVGGGLRRAAPVPRPRRAARQPVPRCDRAGQGGRPKSLSRHFGRRGALYRGC